MLQLLAARARKNHSSSGGTYATLSPTYTNSGVSLSGGNLVATNNRASAGISRSSTQLAGKQYFEVAVTQNSGGATGFTWACGICDASASLAASLGYSNADGWAFWNGAVRHNGSSLYGTSLSNGDVVMIAYDATLGNLWFGKNGVWTNSGSPNPSTGTNPDYSGISVPVFPAVCPWGQSNSDTVCTAKFNPNSFSYSVPAGFSAVTV